MSASRSGAARASVLLIAFTCGSSWLLAQGNSLAARVRALNGDVLGLHSQVQRAAAADAARLRAQAAPVIEQRLSALNQLIAQNPAEALSLAFPADLLADLAVSFPQSASHFEMHGEWQGLIEYLIEDGENLASHRSIRRMYAGSERLEIYFAGREPAGLKSRDLLAARGMRAGNRVAAAGGNITASATAGAACSTFGTQNAVGIMVNFTDYKLAASMTPQLVQDILLGNPSTSNPDWSVRDFWEQNSDGQTSATATVVGPYELTGNFNNGCESDAIRFAAIAAADPYVNFQNYSRILIVMPPNGACGWAGLGSLGCWSNSSAGDGNFTASIAWQRSDQMGNRSNGVRLTTHEFGHNLGNHHASSRDFANEPLGPLNDPGMLNEYGDLFSTMGSWNFGFYSAQQAANILGWLQQNTNYQVVESSGSYSVQAYETRPAGMKALKIRRGTGNDAWVWLEYRQNQGIYDSQLNSQVWSGALLHYYDSTTGTRTHLADFTTGTTSFSDPALASGQTWIDPYSNLTISVGSAVPTGTAAANSALNVNVTYGTIPCTHANPTVTVSPSNPSVNAGSSVSYTVSVRNEDSAGCSSSTYNLGASSLAGWNPMISPASLTLAPGATGNASLTVTPPSGTTPGTYTDAVSASATSGSYTSTGKANCTVTAPPPPLSITVVVPGASYPVRSTVPMTATVLSGSNPRSGATVKFKLQKAGSNKVTNKTGTTGADGKFTWNYKINNSGSYTVSATATYGSQSAASSTVSFTVN